LLGAASIIAIIEVCGKVTSLSYNYSQNVKNATQDIDRLRRKVCIVKVALEGVQELLDELDKTQLLTAYKVSDKLKENLLLLEGLTTKLCLETCWLRSDLSLALIGCWGASIAGYATTSGNHTTLMECPIRSTAHGPNRFV
ncbi:hypothetical protein MMC31_007426, partial [Peltigera leucophlebia]|nr:hypothetical protein [Peltigera leucophlebia]